MDTFDIPIQEFVCVFFGRQYSYFPPFTCFTNHWQHPDRNRDICLSDKQYPKRTIVECQTQVKSFDETNKTDVLPRWPAREPQHNTWFNSVCKNNRLTHKQRKRFKLKTYKPPHKIFRKFQKNFSWAIGMNVVGLQRMTPLWGAKCDPPFSQFSPEYPSGQAQWYLSGPVLLQVPPWRHGCRVRQVFKSVSNKINLN